MHPLFQTWLFNAKVEFCLFFTLGHSVIFLLLSAVIYTSAKLA